MICTVQPRDFIFSSY